MKRCSPFIGDVRLRNCEPGAAGVHLKTWEFLGKRTLENEANTKENRAKVETDY